MTRSGKGKSESGKRSISVEATPDESQSATMARVMVGPYWRHGIVQHDLAKRTAGKLPGDPNFDDFGHSIKAKAEASKSGDMAMASEMLTAQALSLDAMFTELARRATMNLGDYPAAAERYARLAFKAQANSRAALEALAKLHQPREQVVRHVHVNEGGQAVVADHFHNHTGGPGNAKWNEQPHATGTAGAGPALPSFDAQGNGVPISSGERAEAVPDARRGQFRCT